MKITPSIQSSCDLSIYHDSEVSQFVVDYSNHTVLIPLKLPNAGHVTEKTSMLFHNVKSICVNIDEKWGPGIYIYEITIANEISEKNNKGQFFNFTILLNSGDEIRLICESFEICDGV